MKMTCEHLREQIRVFRSVTGRRDAVEVIMPPAVMQSLAREARALLKSGKGRDEEGDLFGPVTFTSSLVCPPDQIIIR